VHGGQIDTCQVRRRGIDEHRFRRVRYTRDEYGTGGASSRGRSCSPTCIPARSWMSSTGATAPPSRPAAGSAPAWRCRFRLVAIDLSSEFRAAIRRALPKAGIP
jgi:hypothetical protein